MIKGHKEKNRENQPKGKKMWWNGDSEFQEGRICLGVIETIWEMGKLHF